MARNFTLEGYKTLKMQGNAEYLPVHQQVAAAIDHGILLGSVSEVEETDTHIRVKVTVRVLNTHLDNWRELPENLQIGYYDGIAETIKGKQGRSAEATFPIETTETSALGRALAKIGLSVNSMATADEMALIERKQQTGSGYGQERVPKEKITELYAAIKKSGITTKEAADTASVEIWKLPINKLSLDQITEWTERLSVPF